MKKKILFFCILFTITFLVSFLLGEVLVRYILKPIHLTPEELKNQSLQYEPALFSKHVFPQKELTAQGAWGAAAYINKKGYRGPNFPVKKPKDNIRIIFYGGSGVYDLNAPLGKDWPHRIEQNLKNNGYPHVEVINAGIPGHSSFDAVGRLFTEGHIFKPDYVVLYEAWNDIRYFHLQEPLLRALKPYNPSIDPRTNYHNAFDRFLCRYSKIYLMLRYQHYQQKIGLEGLKKPIKEKYSTVSTLALTQYKLNIEMFVDIARNINAVPILMTQATSMTKDMPESWRKYVGYGYQHLTHDGIVDAFQQINATLYEVAREKKVPLIDTSKLMTGNGRFFQDHVHLNIIGSQRISDSMTQFLIRLLENQNTSD